MQLAELLVGLPSVQGEPVKVPVPLEVNATVPVEALLVPGEVSVTVAVQVVALPVLTVDGVQFTTVVVKRSETVTIDVPKLAKWSTSGT